MSGKRWFWMIPIGALIWFGWFGWSVRRTVSLAEAQATAEFAFRALRRGDQQAFEALLHASVQDQREGFWQRWNYVRTRYGGLQTWEIKTGETLIGQQRARLIYELEHEQGHYVMMVVLVGHPPRIAELEIHLKVLGTTDKVPQSYGDM